MRESYKGKKLVESHTGAQNLLKEIEEYKIKADKSDNIKEIQFILNDAKRILNEVPGDMPKEGWEITNQMALMLKKATALFDLAKSADQCLSSLSYKLSCNGRQLEQLDKFFETPMGAKKYIDAMLSSEKEYEVREPNLYNGFRYSIVRVLSKEDEKNLIEDAVNELKKLKTKAIDVLSERREDANTFSISKALDRLISSILGKTFNFFSKPTSEGKAEKHMDNLMNNTSKKL